MLSGTGSNRGTKCIRWLARFNPRLTLIGFLGTRAWGLNVSQKQILTLDPAPLHDSCIYYQSHFKFRDFFDSFCLGRHSATSLAAGVSVWQRVFKFDKLDQNKPLANHCPGFRARDLIWFSENPSGGVSVFLLSEKPRVDRSSLEIEHSREKKPSLKFENDKSTKIWFYLSLFPYFCFV